MRAFETRPAVAFVALTLGLHVLSLVRVFVEAGPPIADLTGKSFGLSSWVVISDMEEGPFNTAALMIEELVSATQKRSKLTLDVQGNLTKKLLSSFPPGTQTIIATEREAVIVGEGDRRKTCKSASAELLDELFHKHTLDSLKHDHRIGVARLLQFVHENRDRFQEIPPDDLSASATARKANLGRRFEAKFKIESGSNSQEVRMTLYYSRSALANFAEGVPRIIDIQSLQKFLISYDLRLFKLLPDNLLHGSSESAATVGGTLWENVAGQQYESEVNDVSDDVFAIEPAVGCSRVMLPSEESQLSKLSRGPSRFSFSTVSVGQTAEGPALSESIQVAYEPALTILRVNRILPESTEELLADYNRNRLYHVRSDNKRASHNPDKRSNPYDSFLSTILSFRQNTDASIKDLKLCVVTQARAGSDNTGWMGGRVTNALTLGQLLFGSHDVTYLGLARVRGIEARAFEASDAAWPAWFQHPHVLTLDGSRPIPFMAKGLVYRSDLEHLKNSVRRTVVFYLTRESNNQVIAEDAKLLLIKVYSERFIANSNGKADEGEWRRYKVSVFPIYDFSWDLIHEGPDGIMRREDFFSLPDKCIPEDISKANYANIEMLLQTATVQQEKPNSKLEQLAWLRDPTRRSLAVARALDEQFALPSVMIYDLETRSVSKQKSKVALAITFMAAERTSATVKLVYIGVGAVKQVDGQDQELWRSFMHDFNFDMCFALAAHRQRDTIFAFDASNGQCMILSKIPTDLVRGDAAYLKRLDKIIESLFSFDKGGSYEVYKVVHEDGEKLVASDHITSFARTRYLLANHKRMDLYDPLKELNSYPDGMLTLEVKSNTVEQLNDRTSYDLDTMHLADTTSFEGFGLFSSDKQNKLVQAWRADDFDRKPEVENSLESYQQAPFNTMTFEQCQTACLLDLECKSFSTCIVNARLECVLSSVDFDSPGLVLQLMILRETKSKFGQTFQLILERKSSSNEETTGTKADDKLVAAETKADTIQVKKHPTCELHNKRFFNMFKDVGPLSISVENRRFKPVLGIEQCAEHCFRETLKWLDTAQALSLEGVQKSASRLRTASASSSLSEFQGAKACARFLYIDRANAALSAGDEILAEVDKRLVEAEDLEGEALGYCVFERPKKKSTGKEVKDGQQQQQHLGQKQHNVAFAPARRISFDFSYLYEVQGGISLVQSKKTPAEKSAYLNILVDRIVSPEQLELMKAFVGRGENLGSTLQLRSPANCARYCLDGNQRLDLWPACKSFEFIRITHASKAAKPESTYCAFNSITLREAQDTERFDLIRQGSEQQSRVSTLPQETVRVWHYEPRLGLIEGAFDELFSVAFNSESSHESSQSTFSVNTFALLLVVVFSLALGLGFGLTFSAQALLNSRLARALGFGGPTTEEIQSLVSESAFVLPKIEFSNMVNFEGSVRSLDADDEFEEEVVDSAEQPPEMAQVPSGQLLDT